MDTVSPEKEGPPSDGATRGEETVTQGPRPFAERPGGQRAGLFGPGTWRVLAAAALIWAIYGVFYHVNADYPSYYHNDEPSKTRQIRLGVERWNLRHPPLMLMVTEAIVRAAGIPREDEIIVRVGRVTSAFFSAGAIALLFLTVHLMGGPRLALPVALTTGLHPQIFECAHYFKEDAIYLFGISAFFLVVQLLARSRGVAGFDPVMNKLDALPLRESPRALNVVHLMPAFLGLALAWTIAGKYIGIVLLPLGIVAVAVYFGRDWRAWTGFILVFVTGWALFNAPLLLDAGRALGEVHNETVKLAEGDHGVGLKIPHTLYLGWLALTTNPLTLLLFAAFPVLLGFQGLRRRNTPQWLMVVLVFGTLIGACFMAKYSDRYLLPLFLYLGLFSILSLLVLVRRFRPRWLEHPHGYATVIAVAALLSLTWDIPQVTKRFQGFVIDDRVQLQEYINRYAPEGSSFAIDEMIHLYSNQIGGRPVERSYFVADIGTLEELRERGITHVAVSYDVYWRYVGNQEPAPGSEALHNHRSTFYRRLLDEGEHKFHTNGYHPKPLHPGIMLVDIRGIGSEGKEAEETSTAETGTSQGGS